MTSVRGAENLVTEFTFVFDAFMNARHVFSQVTLFQKLFFTLLALVLFGAIVNTFDVYLKVAPIRGMNKKINYRVDTSI